MDHKDSPTRVVAIADPGLTQQQITTALTTQPDFQLVEALSTLDKVAQHIRATQPEILLIDHQVGHQSSLDTIDELSGQFPEVAVVAILPTGEVVGAQQAMLAGARAFLFQPFTQVNLLSTLRRVRDLESRRRVSRVVAATGAAESAGPLRILAVYSPRGGVGSSTVATNLAVSLLEETSQRVLLFEGKLFFGHLGLMLNLRVPNSIADLIPHAAALEDAIVRDVVVEHASGIDVLLGPANLEVAQGVRPDALFNIISGLRRMYDFIVIDAGSYLSENTVTLMDAADRVLLVTNPELAALQDTSRFVQLTRSLAYPAGKVLTVLNRVGMLGGVKTADIESVLHHELFAQIPDDGPNALRSINRGIPLVLRYPRSPVSRAIQQLAKSLVQISAGEPAGAAAGAPAPKARSQPQVAPARAG